MTGTISKKMKSLAAAVAVAGVLAGGAAALAPSFASASQGADDAVGHVRHSGTDDVAGHIRQSRGADDKAGMVRQGQGADDPAGHIRQSRGADDAPGHVRHSGNDGVGHT
jgi:hypothetical protein